MFDLDTFFEFRHVHFLFQSDFTSIRAANTVLHVITGRPARSAAMPEVFLISGPKIVFFAPQRRHVDPINMKFGAGQRTVGPLPAPNFMFIGAEMWEYSPQNCQNWP